MKVRLEEQVEDRTSRKGSKTVSRTGGTGDPGEKYLHVAQSNVTCFGFVKGFSLA